SKTWIRATCQIVREALQDKTRRKQIAELNQARAVPKRQPKWHEFLASKASGDPEARRLYERIRKSPSAEGGPPEIENARHTNPQHPPPRHEQPGATQGEAAPAESV